jgi:RNA polymerase sigma-32 factor
MSPTPPLTALNELQPIPLYTPTNENSAPEHVSAKDKEVIYNSMRPHTTDDDKSNKAIDVSSAVLATEIKASEDSLLPVSNSTGTAESKKKNVLTKVNRPSRGVQNGDLLSAYLAEIRRYPLLDQQTETELAIRYKEQDDEDAGKRLVTSNLRLVVKMAFKYHSQWANVLDLIQQGNIGLLQALNKYDPYNPTKTRFSSYAAYWIRSCIYNYIKDNYRMVRLGSTRHGRKLFDNLRKVRENLLSQGITPTTKAISDAMEIPEEEIIVFSQHFSAPALSLDTPVNLDDKRSLEEVISSDHFPSPEEDVINTQITERIAEKIAEFGSRLKDARDRAIWERRLLSDVPVSLKELGQDFSVSKERIRQIESRLKLQARTFLSQELGEEFLIDFSF